MNGLFSISMLICINFSIVSMPLLLALMLPLVLSKLNRADKSLNSEVALMASDFNYSFVVMFTY